MKELIERSSFDYNSINDNIAKFLQDKEKNMRETVSDAYYQIGKNLKEAQNELSNHRNGIFQKWYESLGFSKRSVYNYINYYNLVVQQLHDRKKIEQLPKKLAYEIAKPSADSELKQQVLDGDITSRKEYQDLKKAKEELEERVDFLKEINEEAVKERDQEKERKMALKQKIDKYKNEVEFLENNPIIPEDVQARIEELEERAGDLERHKSEVNNYKKKENELYKEINELQEYKRKLEEENNLVAQRAEVVQGIRSEISKFRKSQGKIEKLLKKDVHLRDVDLFNINEEADFLNEMAEKIYNYIASQKSLQEGEVVDV